MRSTVLAASATGASATGLAVAIAFAESIGATPAALYLRTSYFTSKIAIGGLPIEYVAFIWFLAVGWAYARKNARVAAAPLGFFGAAVVVGTGSWFVLRRNPQCWPAIVGSASALAVLAATVADREGWDRGVTRRLGTPWGRAAYVGVAAVVVTIGIALHLRASLVPTREALRADLLRWYAHRTPPARAVLAGMKVDGTRRVTIFTNYLNTEDRFEVPEQLALVQDYRRRGVPVDVVVRPLSAPTGCAAENEGTADVGCLAAVAVRLAHEVRGPAFADDLAGWLYRRGPALSSDLVRHHLRELGLERPLSERFSKLAGAVEDDVSLARALGSNRTPAFFVDGVWVPRGADMLRWILDDYEAR